MFVSSHVLSELEQVCDWLVMIDHGRVVFQGSADELLGRGVTSLAVASERPSDLARLQELLTAGSHRVDVNGAELIVHVGADGQAGWPPPSTAPPSTPAWCWSSCAPVAPTSRTAISPW